MNKYNKAGEVPHPFRDANSDTGDNYINARQFLNLVAHKISENSEIMDLYAKAQKEIQQGDLLPVDLIDFTSVILYGLSGNSFLAASFEHELDNGVDQICERAVRDYDISELVDACIDYIKYFIFCINILVAISKHPKNNFSFTSMEGRTIGKYFIIEFTNRTKDTVDLFMKPQSFENGMHFLQDEPLLNCTVTVSAQTNFDPLKINEQVYAIKNLNKQFLEELFEI